MAEEVSNAARNLPRAIIGAMLINGTVGFAMMITVLYCLGDLDTVLNSATGFPYIQIFYDSVQNIPGAVFMSVVVLLLTWVCASGITTTASRMTWSFARDRGLPFSNILMKVHPRTKIPNNAVFAVTGIAALLTLIYIGSSVGFNAVISLTITGFYGSYLLPASFLLYHRLKGHVMPHGSDRESPETSEAEAAKDGKFDESPPLYDGVGVANARLVWGPWSLPGVLGIINNIYACCYMVFVIFFSVWPPSTPVDASTMNYSIVVTGAVMIFSAVWYFARARREYKGPLIDQEVASVMRRGSIVSVH